MTGEGQPKTCILQFHGIGRFWRTTAVCSQLTESGRDSERWGRVVCLVRDPEWQGKMRVGKGSRKSKRGKPTSVS